MTMTVTLVVLAAVALLLWRRRRKAYRPGDSDVPDVPRTELARTLTHVLTRTPAEELVEAVVVRLLATDPPGRPPRRYAVVHRDPARLEVVERLLEQPELAPVVRVALDLEPQPDGGTAVRYEVLDILQVDRILDRLADVAATRRLVVGAVLRLDPRAVVRDELVTDDDDAPSPDRSGEAADQVSDAP